MNIANKIFFLILIYEFNLIYYPYASATSSNVKPSNSKRSSVGICKANQTFLTPVTVWETKNEPQIINYPCNDGTDKICTKESMVQKKVQKTVSIKDHKLVSVCCKGYKKVGKTCEPRCYPECEHGKCIKPNTCKCDRGYKALTNSKCTPDCQNCKNGYCLTPTDCKCYSLYEKAANGSCVPKCDPKCINGDCLAPDVCTCHAGYEGDALNKSLCHPVCQQSCGNGGRCIAPDRCECSTGYRLNATQQCEPVCESCDNGVCIKPDECQCNEKYESKTIIVGHKLEKRCEPVCHVPCEERGQCIAPDICECSFGYRLNVTGECEPVCDSCDNGVCIKPGECECNEKYERKVIFDGNQFVKRCEPVCQEACEERGRCIAPDVCECSFGYRLNSTEECEPVCDNCDNGVCIKPGECQCNANYESKTINDGVTMAKQCAPICRLSCGDGGLCIEPDVCRCIADYRLNATQQCEPICNECTNGECVAPGKCVCNSGYQLNSTQQCEPICESCENGVCIRPDECECNENYKSVGHTTKRICAPVCQVPCGLGGNCAAPNVCECGPNYRLNTTKQCEPICERCDNGVCVAPGKCRCNKNYESKRIKIGDKIIKRCEPICTNPCVNGFCSDVNECTCDEGYERDEHLKHVCNRICDPPCVNGTCKEDNVCECLPGLLEHSFKDHVCVDCTFTCPNSDVCPMPEGCPCGDSMEFNVLTNSCERVPVPTLECSGKCINSNCTYGQCICFDGYNKINHDSNICFPLCNNKLEGCIKGKCIAPDMCECYENYTLSPYTEFECIAVENPKLPTTKITTNPILDTTTITSISTTDTSVTSSSSPSPTPSLSSVLETDILDQGLLNQVPDIECIDGDCQNEMERIQEDGLLLKAHYNYIFIVIGVAVLSVIIILTMIYRKYNRTKTFKTHEQEAFLSSPYFIGGPIKTSCDIELDEN